MSTLAPQAAPATETATGSPTMAALLKTLPFGPAPCDARPALDWIAGLPKPDGAGPDSPPPALLRNPATGDGLWAYRRAALPEARAALARARAAMAGLAAPDWGLGLLDDLAKALAEQGDRLTVLAALETGRALRDLSGQDWPAALAALAHARSAGRLAGLRAGPAAPRLHEAALVLTGAEDPLGDFARLAAPALAVGRAVVLAPAAQAPLALLALCEIAQALARARGLPDGLLVLLPGGAATARDLARAAEGRAPLAGRLDAELPPELPPDLAPDPTGDLPQDLAADLAGLVPRLALERDGPWPVIVLADADLDSAAQAMAQSLARRQPLQLLLAEAIAQPLLDRLAARLARLQLGDPLDLMSDLGPMPGPAQAEAARSLARAAQGQGARPILCPPLARDGAALAALDDQAWCLPRLIADLMPAHPARAALRAGPLAGAQSFRHAPEALALAQAEPFARAAAIWGGAGSACLALARALAKGPDAPGTVWVNDLGRFDPALPAPALRAAGPLGLFSAPDATSDAALGNAMAAFWRQADAPRPGLQAGVSGEGISGEGPWPLEDPGALEDLGALRPFAADPGLRALLAEARPHGLGPDDMALRLARNPADLAASLAADLAGLAAGTAAAVSLDRRDALALARAQPLGVIGLVVTASQSPDAPSPDTHSPDTPSPDALAALILGLLAGGNALLVLGEGPAIARLERYFQGPLAGLDLPRGALALRACADLGAAACQLLEDPALAGVICAPMALPAALACRARLVRAGGAILPLWPLVDGQNPLAAGYGLGRVWRSLWLPVAP